jgi:hypothetical protein
MLASKTKRILKKDLVPQGSKIFYPDNLRFGCEFEFYINGNNQELIVKELERISGSDILINLDEIPKEKDIHECLCLKFDSSLGSEGAEISVPICSYDTLCYYIGHILYIIEEFGTTNEDTGFHIHISTTEKEEMDFYAFILLCNEANLLNNWGNRNQYSLNPMEILNFLNEKEARKLKNKKGRVWSIERRGQAHVEIRTMGGLSYHIKVEQIHKELDMFIEIFKQSISDIKENIQYKEVLKQHLEILKNTNKNKTERFQKFIATINPIIR